MKINRRKVQAALIALMMISSAMMMGACGSSDSTDSSGEFSDTAVAYHEVAEDEEDSPSEAREYSYEDNSTTNNYTYEYNTYENSDSSGGSSASSDDSGSEWQYEDGTDFDYSYEEPADDEDYDEDYDNDCYYEEPSNDEEDTGSGNDSSYGISETDYANDAYVSTNDFEINPLPVRIGGTNATIKADVINRSGRHVTGVGCTLYYTFGDAIKSTLVSCDCDYESFHLEFDINRDLDEMLDRGLCYKYKIFVEADGNIYTHDSEKFTTNDIDDRIEIEESVSSVSTTSASVNVKVFNPTGANVEAIGCRFGDGLLLISEDKITGNFTDTEFDETFTFPAPDGVFPSGYTYSYEVYVVCNGHEYMIGTSSFKTPLY